MPDALLLGAHRSAPLAEQIAAGQHPRVEYLALCQRYDLDLVSFDDVPQNHGFLQPFAKRLGPYWSLAAWGRRHRPRWPSLLTTGEDLGLPAWIVQRFTAARQSLAIITHGSYFGSPRFRHIARLLRGSPRVRFLCLSESLRQQMIGDFGFPPEQVVNAGYGVDTDFFRPGVVPPSSEYQAQRPVAAAGVARRDYRTLVRAVKMLNRPDLPVKIAADSAWFQGAVDITGDALPPNVEARSFGDYLGLRQLYADAAFVVVPMQNVRHACGYAVIVEAMAMGKTVITSRIVGHSDYIIEGETGFYVPVGDATALRDRMDYLLSNPDVAETMGRKARALIESQFSLDAYVQRIAAAANLTPRDSQKI